MTFLDERWGFDEVQRRALADAPPAYALSDRHFAALFGEQPEPGPQLRTVGAGVGLFVIPEHDRERWLVELERWLGDVRERPTSRAFVLDAENRLLLVRFRNRFGETWWCAPGGGVDPGESYEDAIRRELREEAGLEIDEPGAPVWTREVTFSWGARLVRLDERYFLVRVDEHEPAPTIDLTAENVVELAWWTPAELAAPRERLAPLNLPDLVARHR